MPDIHRNAGYVGSNKACGQVITAKAPEVGAANNSIGKLLLVTRPLIQLMLVFLRLVTTQGPPSPPSYSAEHLAARHDRRL